MIYLEYRVCGHICLKIGVSCHLVIVRGVFVPVVDPWTEHPQCLLEPLPEPNTNIRSGSQAKTI